jgi:hypothetical protein
MPLAGYCRQCGQYVYLTEQWGCVNGHAWNEISGWYEAETGVAVTPSWMQAPPPAAVPEPVPVPAAPPLPEPAPLPEAVPVPAPVTVQAPAAAPTPAPEQLPAPAPAPAQQSASIPEPVPVPAVDAASDRLALLADILATFAQYPSFNAEYGTDADIVVDNQLVDANWGAGKKKVEYSAVMKAVESEGTLYFWEILKESGAGLNFGGFEAETYGVSGKSRSGVQKMMIVGTDGVPVEWEWDYANTRRIVEDVAARHGWKTKVVLQKKSAQW